MASWGPVYGPAESSGASIENLGRLSKCLYLVNGDFLKLSCLVGRGDPSIESEW